MEVLIGLLIAAVVILPPTAFFLSLGARNRLREMGERLDELQRQLDELKQAGFSVESRRPSPAKILTVSESPVPASPAMAAEPVAQAPAIPITAPAKTPAGPPPLPPGMAFERAEVSATAEESPKPSDLTEEPKSSWTPPEPVFRTLGLDKINWEQFMGVRLFAWLGGLALFLAAAFFVKYSFEHDLIPPEVRVAMGFLAGIGLVVGGTVLSRKQYLVTAHTLCATGVVILYAVTFACRAVYHFPLFGPTATFGLMVAVTVVAFLMAVRLEAMVVAVLGMLGGFLTPILLSTGQDNPVGLFTYIALLDIGLIAVAAARRWDWLNLASAVGTVLMQWAWVLKFFTVAKVYVAMTIFLGFDVLYLAALVWAYRREQLNQWLAAAAAGLPLMTMLFTLYLLSFSGMGARPGMLAIFLFGADLCLVAVSMTFRPLRMVQLVGGGMAFVILSLWTLRFLTPELLWWGLAIDLGFAAMHALFPVALQRRYPEERIGAWGHLFPILALLLVLMPVLQWEHISFLVWPAILLMDLLAIGLAVMTASVIGIFLVLLVTALVACFWMMRIPEELTQLPLIMLVVFGFVAVFGGAGLFLGRKILTRAKTETGANLDDWLPAGFTSAQLQQQIPALSAILPFLLLVMVVTKLPLGNPSPVFGMAWLLLALLLGLTKYVRLEWLPSVGLGCVLLLEYTWHVRFFTTTRAGMALSWYLAFYLTLFLFPFLFLRGQADRLLSWISSALSGPLHFLLIYHGIKRAWPNEMMGMVPAVFALPTLAGLVAALKQIAPDHPKRNAVLACFGGVVLLFITLVFPIQFERQWLTIAWGLEGTALLWLYFRIPHPGLRIVGIVLLVTAFARLALNPAVLSYHPRASVAIFNWYLYTYGLVTASLFTAARLLPPPDNRVLKQDPLPLLYTLGTVLAFLLLNIEIADYFTTQGTRTLTFRFSGSFARDMTYSMAWSLFALLLLVVGILKKVRAARYAGMALLGVTLLKLFFHDLASLAQLYRVGALVVVAVVAIVVSFLYQKFLSHETKPEEAPAPGELPPKRKEPHHE